MINHKNILRLTMHGLNIYSHVLGCYSKKGVYLEVEDNESKPTCNPFNDNKKTLILTNYYVTINDDKSLVEMFCYQDTELAEFKGHAFDFAALHYHLSGDALLEKINQDLNLHLEGKNNSYEPYIDKEPVPVTELALPRFSFYYAPVTNTTPYVSVNLLDVYKAVKGNRYKPRTLRLRAFPEAEEAAKFKRKSFDYVTFAGVFTKRSDKALLHPSGLMVFDFDKVSDLPLLKKSLLDDPLFVTELMFTSPGGKGLKWIISVDLKQCSHEEWFAAVASYLDTVFQIKVDRSGKDLSRACFLCHDPEVYINPAYLDSTD